MYVVKSRATNVVVGQTTDVEEALVMEAAGFRVDGVGYVCILELAEARVKACPDRDALPSQEDKYARYISKAGNPIIVEVIRLTNPDHEGYPQHAEVINMSKPDGSFMVETSRLTAVDLRKMSPALANALLQPGTYEQDGGGNMPKLTRGLRKKPE